MLDLMVVKRKKSNIDCLLCIITYINLSRCLLSILIIKFTNIKYQQVTL